MSGGSGRFRWWVLCCGVVLGLEVPVSIDCSQDIWPGMSLDGLWFNIHRLIYYLSVTIDVMKEAHR